ncbi:cation transporter [Paenibacillus alba]|uniref:cation diffusion facilitator family transporter n=1 Tax=Paenibacillus alba TaxID=1197127 RepID=UPI0015651C89|nr:cation diffusion facilitator family transporter [Paenibacillus alba]NQX68015.1 cation transporter [Paenibacillus alba]
MHQHESKEDAKGLKNQTSCSGHDHHKGDEHASHSHSQGHDHDHGHGHGHGHHHGHHHHGHSGNKRGLIIALGITASIMILEFVGGLWTNSLALLSDSGHMLSDAGSLALSLMALWFAAKPTSASKSYGFHRTEILTALFNAVTLFLIAGFIIWEAFGRFTHPPVVASGSMMLIASVGLIANLLSAWSLMRQGDVHSNLNLRSAYLHILGDALGSVGAIVAGGVMLIFGWYAADPIISVIVALLILKGAWAVLKSTVHILMEGTPAAVSHGDVQIMLEGIEGVINVHDLHIWTITSGLDSLSCHLLIADDRDSQVILQQAIRQLEERFQLTHATIQIENSTTMHSELKV